MIKVKIASKLPEMKSNSSNPSFNYSFKEADEPIEIPENHAEKILKNDNFYISDKEVKKQKKVPQIKPKDKTWADELLDNGIKSEDAESIILIYPKKGDLLKALSKEKEEVIPLNEKLIKILKGKFIH